MQILAKKGDIITVKKDFDNKIFKYNGDALILDTDFKTVEVPDASGTSIHNIITTVEAHSFEAGDEVMILESDGIYRPNVIVNVGPTKIETVKPILKSGAVTVKFNGTKIELLTLENNIYTFSDNSTLIINDTYFNIKLDLSELRARVRNLMDYRADIDSLINAAKKSVLADFGSDLTAFRALDTGRLEELVIRKIEMILEQATDGLKYTNSYNALLKEASLYLKSDNGKLNRGIGLLPDSGVSESSDYCDPDGNLIEGYSNSNNLKTRLILSWGAR